MEHERTLSRKPAVAERRPVPARAPIAARVATTSTLQQRLGNHGVQSFASNLVARQYTLSHPDDAAEREADRTAEHITREPQPASASSPVKHMHDGIARSHDRAGATDTGAPAHGVAPGVAASVAAMRGGGAALPAPTRTFFESRMGANLGRVRVHTGTQAADTAAALHARAFTVGPDIAFGAGEYAPDSPDGRRLLAHELTHVLQQGDAEHIQRWKWPWEDSEEEKREKERKVAEVNAIIAVWDYSTYTEAQRIDMLHKLIAQNRSGSSDERAIERIWNSFGKEFSRIAGENEMLWFMCSNRVHWLFDEVPEARRIRDAFAGDVREIAMRNLRINQEYAEEEMQRLGLPRNLFEIMLEPTAAQAGELARLQVAAEGLAKLQGAQEAARSAAVGYTPVLLGESWEDPGYRRVTFDTNKPPPLTQLPGGGIKFYDDTNEQWISFTPWGLPPPARSYLDEAEGYESMLSERQRLTAIVPYAPLKERYDQATAAIAATLTVFPQLYALTVQNKAAVVGDLANAQSPRAARDVLAAAFRELLRNIERTRTRLGDGDLDPLDLIPIHQRMFEGKEEVPSGVAWSQAFPRAVAERLTRDHNISRALRQLLLQSIAQIAFLLAPVAGPLAVPLLLVGTTASGANLVLDLQRYNALADASRAGAKPGTQLVTPGQVDEARMAVEADAIAFALGLLALGAAAGTAAIRRYQASQQTRALALRTRLIGESGAPSEVYTNRPEEVPYGIGDTDMQVVKPGSPLKIDGLNPNRKYLWVLDEAGDFRIADEGQGKRFPQRYPLPKEHPAAGETPLKHGDLTPGPGGKTRGVARAGGELTAEVDAAGKPTGRWIMDNNSSYTFARKDAQTLTAANLEAARDLLKTTGTDVSRIVTKSILP
jgi:hypothetical protein